MKKGIKVVLAAASALLISAPAFAFHSGGVGECEGCHTMHNSLDGVAVATGMPQYQAGPYLLKAQDASGSCLNCHNANETTGGSYHISSNSGDYAAGVAPAEYTPGGDFGWLKKTYNFSIRNNPTSDPGETHGHNIVAVDFGYVADSRLLTAPGGSYPAANLACSSCHDPHGQYRRLANGTQARTGLPIFNSGSYNSSADPISGVGAVGVYRILAGVGYQPKSLTGSYAFTYPAPDAVAPSTYNRSEATAQTHVAYGKGMSEYCANCHTKMLENGFTSGMKGLVHPAGNGAKLTAPIVANYNAYVTSGIMTNTDPTKAYSTLVPFELGTADYSVLKPLAVNTDDKDQSASTSANVSCLSCHRAHASGFESMARYSLTNEFMTIADSAGVAQYDSSTTEGKVNYGKNVAEQTAAYYGRPATAFGPYARNLCNKCHAKD
ncbi:MAG: cytochrome C [Geobacter sp.]|nr:MAG: cytochrome C [Geobacter sp.]